MPAKQDKLGQFARQLARLFHSLNRCCDHSLTNDRRVGSSPLDKRAKSLSDLPLNTISSSRDFIGMAGICRDRLLEQRSALRKPDCSFDFPPLRGGLRSLSVGADCFATKSRALFGLLF
jgi:hypothetical protein